MKITLILIGKTEEENIKKGCAVYENKLKHYITFEIITIPALKNTKNLTIEQQKEKEADLLIKYLHSSEYVILLDEHGKEFNSVEFANFFQQKMNSGMKNITFVIGGAYGFTSKMLNKATFKLSLSRMTFSHQMVRLLFIEQLYRAMTILKNEPYHHE